MRNKIITVGGSTNYTDRTEGFNVIEASLKLSHIEKDEIKFVYGFGDADKEDGAYFIAKDWAEANNLKFVSGRPKFEKYNHLSKEARIKFATAERNESLAKISSVLIQLVVGNSTGGNTITKAFEDYGVPVYKYDLPKPPFVPESSDLEKSIELCSEVAKFLVAKAVILDTETTGLARTEDKIIELAVAKCSNGKVLFDSLVYTDRESQPEALAVNGIDREMLEGMPTLDALYEKLSKAIEGKIVVASNSDFDEEMLFYNLKEYGLRINALWVDLLTLYRRYSSQPKSKVRSLNTEKMCKQMGVEAGRHRALSDVKAELEVLHLMAEGKVPEFI